MRLPFLVALLVVAGVRCAALPSPETGPGGLPYRCTLPECALPGDYSTLWEAVQAGFAAIRQKPDWREIEYSGCVFRMGGRYRITHVVPFPNPEYRRTLCIPPRAPDGAEEIANFHNHPTREAFSVYDREAVPLIPHYMLAPSGTVYRYTPATRTTGATERWAGAAWEAMP